MKHLRLGITKQDYVKYAIIFNIAYSSYATLFYSLFGMSSMLRNIMMLSVIGIDLWAIKKNGGRKKLNTLIILFLFFSMLLLSTAVFFPGNRDFVKGIVFDVIKYTIFAWIISVSNEMSFNEGFRVGAIIIVICGLFEPFTRYVTGGHDGYMVFGMRMLLGVVILEYFYRVRKSKVDLLLALLGSILILLYGNRSAFLIIVFCYVLYFMRLEKVTNNISKYLYVIIGGISVVIMLFFQVHIHVYNLLSSLGISSRTMDKMISGVEDAVDNTGRSIIWANCISAIKEKPIWGYGIGGERYLPLLGQRYYDKVGDSYAHNFVLELIIDFGVVVGPIVVILIMYALYLVVKDREWFGSNLSVGIILATVIKLLFSSSIWVDMNTYICLGIVLLHKRTKMQTSRNSMFYKMRQGSALPYES